VITTNDMRSFFQWSFNKTVQLTRSDEMYGYIYEILNYYGGKDKEGLMPMDEYLNFDFLKTVLDLHFTKDKCIPSSISNVLSQQKFSKNTSFMTYFHNRVTEDISEVHLKSIIDSIASKMEKVTTQIGIPDLKKVVDILTSENEDECYDSASEEHDEYRKLVMGLYAGLEKADDVRGLTSQSGYSAGLDNTDELEESIVKKSSPENKVTSGFAYIDDSILGGFEAGRLYIIAGTPGSGKSTLVLSMCHRAALSPDVRVSDGKKKIYFYLTLENRIDETHTRALCMNNGIDTLQLIRKLKEEKQRRSNGDKFKSLGDEWRESLAKNNSYIEFDHFEIESISCSSIFRILDRGIKKYGGYEKAEVKCIYIDYLDLMKLNISGKKDWQGLGVLTQEMKSIATILEIPVVSATQLNRAATEVEYADDLNQGHISESFKKVAIADTIIAISRCKRDNNLVLYNMIKNRSGMFNIPLDITVNYAHFKFLDANPAKMRKKKSDSSSSAAYGAGITSSTKDVLKIDEITKTSKVEKDKTTFKGFEFNLEGYEL